MPEHDLIVIGAGPGGYVAAIRAAQLGMNVGCIEKEQALGGTCLRVGCIPSKALLESSELYYQSREHFAVHGIAVKDVSVDLSKMMGRKEEIVGTLTRGVDGLFKKHKIKRYVGHGRIAGPGKVFVEAEDGATTELGGKNILIATGSRSADLKGVELDGERIVTSTEALSFKEVPKHLVVIGGGYIGLEMAMVWQRLGSQVTVVEYLDRILPGSDAEIAAEAKKIFSKQGLDFRLGMRVQAAKVGKSGCVVECEGADPIECDRVLLAVGRRPFTDNLGLENLGIQLDDRGRIDVDHHFRTRAAGVYAIGDVIRGPMLAHKAEDEGVACVEYISTGHGHVNYDAIPAVVYTDPEIASVGKTEEQLKEAGIDYKVGKFPFAANGRARALNSTAGWAKMLADAHTDRILGMHIIGPRAGDLIAEIATGIEFGASSEDIARCSHAHPTLSEAVKEAALAVEKRTLNF